MPNLSETSQWETGIYKIEEDDVVQGGDDGISNRAAAQLANRTLFLKNQQTAHQEAADPHTQYLREDKKATEAQAIAGLDNESWMTALRVAQAINALAATIANASETVAGKVELATPAETITGADTTRATHAAGVKAAIDAAVAALLDSTPATLNTLNELAAALGDDANFATSMATALSAKLNITDYHPSASAPVGASVNAKMVIAADSASGTFTADEIIVETALGGTAYRLTNYSQTVNLATVGAAGMDTGLAPVSGYVSLYAITKADGTKSILACNASTSSGSVYSGANMPAGYVASALIAIIPTNASRQFIAGGILGRKFFYEPCPVVLNLTSGLSVTYTAVDLSAAVPPAASSAILNIGQPVGGNSQLSGIVAANSDGLASAIVNLYGNSYAVDGFYSGIQVTLPIFEAQTMYYKVGTAVNGIRINVSGYVF